LQPLGESTLLSGLDRPLDTQLCSRLLDHLDNIALPQLVGRNVDALAIHQNAVMPYDLARFSARRAESHAVGHGVQPALEELQQILTRDAFAAIRLSVDLAELTLQYAVDTPYLLLLSQLRGIA